MRRNSRLQNNTTGEVGWISTTDMFVVATCLFLFLAVTARGRTSQVEEQLGSVTEQLELSQTSATSNEAVKIENILREREQLLGERERLKSASTAAAVRIEAMLREREQLLAEHQKLNEQIVSISDQRMAENTSNAKEKQSLSAELKKREDELELSEREVSKLTAQIESARQAVVLAREQAISQQRSINNKLVGLGGKLEKVVFMVDISNSMQSIAGPNGTVLNNWVPIVEVIERWINGLNVTSASLIVFGDSAEVKVEMQELNRGGREKILEVLKQIDPTATSTNFLAAFEKAYQIPDVDTIIVFSDGLPTVDINGNRIFVGDKIRGESDDAYKRRVDKEVADNVNRALTVHRKISDMARENPSVAVNAIGLGAGVYNEKTGNLLSDLALKNGGVFLALPSRIVEDEKP